MITVCVQRFNCGGDVLERYRFNGHAWVADDDDCLSGVSWGPVTLTRTWRCLRCGETWSVTGQLSPAYLGHLVPV